MKKIALFLSVMMICGIASAQFAGGMRGQQQEPLPDGYKPSSTNTFLPNTPLSIPRHARQSSEWWHPTPRVSWLTLQEKNTL